MDILFEGGAIAFALAAVLVVLAIVAPLIGVVVDLVLAILLTALGAAGRLLFRRPWSVEAVSDKGERHRWEVVGWRASGELVADVVNALAHGHVLPAASAVDDATNAPR